MFVVTKNGAQTVYTIGCNTGTLVSEGSISLVEKIDDGDIPDTPAEAERKRIMWEKQRAIMDRKGIPHSYRRFD
jgi:hypothetical protein